MARPSGSVLCLGEALIDLIGAPAAPAAQTKYYLPRVGGAPANVAVGLARLGIPVAFVGTVGDDPFAETIVERLTSEGVSACHIARMPGASTRLSVVTGPPGRRAFTFYGDRPADTRLSPEMVHAALGQEATALYLSSLPLATEPSRSALLEAVAVATTRGIPICFDPNPRRRMDRMDREVDRDLAAPGTSWPREEMLDIAASADLLKLSVADLDVLELAAEDLPALAGRAHLLVLTDGMRGCDYWIDGARSHHATFEVTAVDETGAGDAFTAALIARGVESGFRFSPADLTFASAAGALAATGIGAMDALPSREQIAALTGANAAGNS